MNKFRVPFELKSLDLDEGTFEGYASVFGNVDDGGDVIEPGAFTKTLQERGGRIKICWNHDPYEPIGTPISMTEDSKGLLVKGKISKTRRGMDVLTLMRDGVINELSIGYSLIKHKMDGRIRKITELKLWEFSPVTWAMNPQAQILGVKSVMPFGDLPLADAGVGWDGAAAEKSIRAWAGGPNKEDVDWEKYAKGFFWVDPENSDNFTGYKLPFADVVDGELKAIPAGIFAVAGAVQGSRGGVDIDDSELDKVKGVVAKYYEKMGKTPPWSKEEKAGRMLSGANIQLIRSAVSALQALLEAAEPVTELEAAGKEADQQVTSTIEQLDAELKQFIIEKGKVN